MGVLWFHLEFLENSEDTQSLWQNLASLFGILLIRQNLVIENTNGLQIAMHQDGERFF